MGVVFLVPSGFSLSSIKQIEPCLIPFLNKLGQVVLLGLKRKGIHHSVVVLCAYAIVESIFRYNMVKGRVAETLIQELFLSLVYNVFHYGMERSVPGIANLIKNNSSPVARDIRSMPDFTMQDPRKDEVYFVEVKYRASESFHGSF